jgi:hypothetical protein
MDTDSSGMGVKTEEEAVPERTCRPPPIILTSSANLIQLQKQLKSVVKGDFEFRSTRNGTRVITKGMADSEAIKSYFTNNNLSFYTFFPKSLKPIKAVIRYLPPNTPAEDISDGLVNQGFDVISVKQMTSTRRSSSEGVTTRNLPFFLITLPRTAKSQKIFKLPSLCHISISVEAYMAQTVLTQCHNCQQFGHVWTNCRQPPRCLWCRGGHLHKECPEKGNAASTPACCNCQLAEGRKPTLPIIGDADTPRRSLRKGRHRGHPNRQRDGCSPRKSPPQVCPSLRLSEAVTSSNSALWNKIQWQAPPQREDKVYRLLCHNRNQVSQLRLEM